MKVKINKSVVLEEFDTASSIGLGMATLGSLGYLYTTHQMAKLNNQWDNGEKEFKKSTQTFQEREPGGYTFYKNFGIVPFPDEGVPHYNEVYQNSKEFQQAINKRISFLKQYDKSADKIEKYQKISKYIGIPGTGIYLGHMLTN